MKYENAEKILPQDIIDTIQEYIQGGYLYIPTKKESKVKWGENTGTRELLNNRNKSIYDKYVSGSNVGDLAQEYYLTPHSIRRIIRNYKI